MKRLSCQSTLCFSLAALLVIASGCHEEQPTQLVPTWQPTFAVAWPQVAKDEASLTGCKCKDKDCIDKKGCKCKDPTCSCNKACKCGDKDCTDAKGCKCKSGSCTCNPKTTKTAALPSYAQQKARAVYENKPLIVWIGQVSTYNEDRMPEFLHARVGAGWGGEQGPAVALCLPWNYTEGKGLWWAETLGATAGAPMIRDRVSYHLNPANHEQKQPKKDASNESPTAPTYYYQMQPAYQPGSFRGNFGRGGRGGGC